ncbi:MAG TPA: 7-cyano-7-deazaguanine synthase, partial [Desulfotomaculum sp.]|nr:7-cyano-7-deazaguanine synthase [Desulfotomaculum sp.]
KVVSYTQRLDKVEIVYLGQCLGIPWDLLWSCYFGGQAACGRWESCPRYQRACKSANLSL